MNERCVLCGDNAAVRVSGTSFCASCGLSQYSADAAAPARLKRRSRRAAFFALFSSGMLVKTLLGAVALAAVGGAAASTVMHSGDEPVVVETTVVSATAAATTATTAETTSTSASTTSAPLAAEPASEDVDGYVAAVQAWADCVATAASEHAGGSFDPAAACDKPRPADYGLDDGETDQPVTTVDAPGLDEDGEETIPPGHDEDGPGESENAPGHDEDGPGASEDAPGQNKDK